MATPLEHFQQRQSDHWLLCHSSHEFSQLTQHFIQALRQLKPVKPTKVLIAESDPLQFLASFTAACIENCQVFLANPDWGSQEWQQALTLIQPDLIWQNGVELSPHRDTGGQRNSHSPHLPIPPSPTPLIAIPTGGSSGKIRFAMHTWQTLTASVVGFQRYFEVDRIHSCCTLPLYHVSGLMQFIRSLVSGGKLAILPFKQLESGQIPDWQPEGFFISLVPTQLQRCLDRPALAQWLSQFETVLLGGAPAWSALLTQARMQQIRLAPTYGMTETASQIATLKPEDFLRGMNGSGRVLPHAMVSICSATGERLGRNHIGIVTIQAKSLAIGDYPHLFHPDRPLQTDDLGFFDEQGFLHIVSRNSQKIITGGENVFPAEVEAAIYATGLVQDVCVIGLPDREWGQIVTAVYVSKSKSVAVEELQAALRNKLTKFKYPKRWIAVQHLPRNANGKLNYSQLTHLIHPFPIASTTG